MSYSDQCNENTKADSEFQCLELSVYKFHIFYSYPVHSHQNTFCNMV